MLSIYYASRPTGDLEHVVNKDDGVRFPLCSLSDLSHAFREPKDELNWQQQERRVEH